MKKYRIKKGKAYIGRVELKEEYRPVHWVSLDVYALLMDKRTANRVLNHFKDETMVLEEVEIKPKKKERTITRAEREVEEFLLNDVGEFGRC